ncbi:hypothetical protein [Rhizobium leguminosarum]
MTNASPLVWEDDEYVYIPEELFQHLPPEYLERFETRKHQGEDVLRIADTDIKSLVRLAKAIPTTSSLSYVFHRLRTAKFDLTAEALMEQEMLTTAFVVTYSKLFISGSGGSGISRDQIPLHLRQVHDDIIELRHNRYAHNGSHTSIGSGIQIDFDDAEFRVTLQVNMGFHVGGRDEWEQLVRFLDGHIHDRLTKILNRLKAKTGYEWTFPVGPAPDWIGK